MEEKITADNFRINFTENTSKKPAANLSTGKDNLLFDVRRATGTEHRYNTHNRLE